MAESPASSGRGGISSNPAVIATAKSPSEAAGLLSQLVADAQHVYLDTLPPPASEGGIVSFPRILGHRQVTGAYLLMLATLHDAALVTFDRRLESLSTGRRVRVLGLGSVQK